MGSTVAARSLGFGGGAVGWLLTRSGAYALSGQRAVALGWPARWSAVAGTVEAMWQLVVRRVPPRRCHGWHSGPLHGGSVGTLISIWSHGFARQNIGET